MISVLIPVYNYNIIALVNTLYEQLVQTKLEFEILCLDDGSDNNYTDINLTLNDKPEVSYSMSKQNIGRTKTRQILANKAQNDWLLFLDADVLPVSNTFIKKYYDNLNPKFDVINGGIAYKNERPESQLLLRWKYGRQQEQKSASFRNSKPYKIITSGNFIIKKDLFLKLNAKIEKHTYGLDNIFGATLKTEGAHVLHINNEVYHLGLESNTTYLKKKENSALTVLSHYKAGKITDHQNDLLRYFVRAKQFGLNFIFNLIYKLFQGRMKNNLLGQKPSIRLLQLYRLSYMCHMDLQTKS